MSVLRAGRGMGVGVEVFSNWNLGGGGGFQKCSRVLKRMHNFILIFFRGGGILGCLGRPTPHAPPGSRAGSENDTLLPMTMTCDRLKFWSGPQSKIIIRKPWRRKNKKNKTKFWKNHKAFPAGSWECLITWEHVAKIWMLSIYYVERFNYHDYEPLFHYAWGTLTMQVKSCRTTSSNRTASSL